MSSSKQEILISINAEQSLTAKNFCRQLNEENCQSQLELLNEQQLDAIYKNLQGKFDLEWFKAKLKKSETCKKDVINFIKNTFEQLSCHTMEELVKIDLDISTFYFSIIGNRSSEKSEQILILSGDEILPAIMASLETYYTETKEEDIPFVFLEESSKHGAFNFLEDNLENTKLFLDITQFIASTEKIFNDNKTLEEKFQGKQNFTEILETKTFSTKHSEEELTTIKGKLLQPLKEIFQLIQILRNITAEQTDELNIIEEKITEKIKNITKEKLTITPKYLLDFQEEVTTKREEINKIFQDQELTQSKATKVSPTKLLSSDTKIPQQKLKTQYIPGLNPDELKHRVLIKEIISIAKIISMEDIPLYAGSSDVDKEDYLFLIFRLSIAARETKNTTEAEETSKLTQEIQEKILQVLINGKEELTWEDIIKFSERIDKELDGLKIDNETRNKIIAHECKIMAEACQKPELFGTFAKFSFNLSHYSLIYNISQLEKGEDSITPLFTKIEPITLSLSDFFYTNENNKKTVPAYTKLTTKAKKRLNFIEEIYSKYQHLLPKEIIVKIKNIFHALYFTNTSDQNHGNKFNTRILKLISELIKELQTKEFADYLTKVCKKTFKTDIFASDWFIGETLEIKDAVDILRYQLININTRINNKMPLSKTFYSDAIKFQLKEKLVFDKNSDIRLLHNLIKLCNRLESIQNLYKEIKPSNLLNFDLPSGGTIQNYIELYFLNDGEVIKNLENAIDETQCISTPATSSRFSLISRNKTPIAQRKEAFEEAITKGLSQIEFFIQQLSSEDYFNHIDYICRKTGHNLNPKEYSLVKQTGETKYLLPLRFGQLLRINEIIVNAHSRQAASYETILNLHHVDKPKDIKVNELEDIKIEDLSTVLNN